MKMNGKSTLFRALAALVLITALSAVARAAPDVDPAVVKGKALIS